MIRTRSPFPKNCKYCSCLYLTKGTNTLHCSEMCYFLDHCDEDPIDDRCRLWTGYVWDGYGKTQFRRLCKPAHVMSFNLFVGAVPEGHVVRHKCNVPRCVNWRHLETGPPKENSQDMVKAGRSLTGIKNNSAVLTEEDVHAIRLMVGPSSKIARQYKVNKTTIIRVRLRRSWRHLP